MQKIYSLISSLNVNNNIVFCEYNKQLRYVVNNAVINNKILFLPKHLQYVMSESTQEYSFNYLVNKYKDYFSKINCDYFVINALPRDDVSKHAALVAASELSPVVRTIYLEHGDTGFNDSSAVWRWLHYCDYYYASNTESRRYIEAIRDKYNETCFIKEWKRPIPKRKKSSNYVLFAPGFYNGELFIGLVPDTLKYRTIKLILE